MVTGLPVVTVVIVVVSPLKAWEDFVPITNGVFASFAVTLVLNDALGAINAPDIADFNAKLDKSWSPVFTPDKLEPIIVPLELILPEDVILPSISVEAFMLFFPIRILVVLLFTNNSPVKVASSVLSTFCPSTK